MWVHPKRICPYITWVFFCKTKTTSFTLFCKLGFMDHVNNASVTNITVIYWVISRLYERELPRYLTWFLDAIASSEISFEEVIKMSTTIKSSRYHFSFWHFHYDIEWSAFLLVCTPSFWIKNHEISYRLKNVTHTFTYRTINKRYAIV